MSYIICLLMFITVQYVYSLKNRRWSLGPDRSRSWRSCIAPSRMARQSLSGKSLRYHTYLFPYIHNNGYLNVYIYTICVCECGAIANCPRLGHALYSCTSRRATWEHFEHESGVFSSEVSLLSKVYNHALWNKAPGRFCGHPIWI